MIWAFMSAVAGLCEYIGVDSLKATHPAAKVAMPVTKIT